MSDILVVAGLIKRFGTVTALNRVTWRFQYGEVMRAVAADEIRPSTGKSIGEYYLEVFRHDKAN